MFQESTHSFLVSSLLLFLFPFFLETANLFTFPFMSSAESGHRGRGMCFIDTYDVCSFYCRFSFRRSCFNKWEEFQGHECHADAQKHWNTVMSSCLGREGQRHRPSASLELSMKRSGMKEGWRVKKVVLVGGRGSQLQDWGRQCTVWNVARL